MLNDFKPDFFRYWFRIALFNLLLVSLLGLTMRYKIAFSLPWINQRYFLNAHSHFAFAGWLSQVLMTFLADYLVAGHRLISARKYNYLLGLNLFSAYGMLLSFPFQGYAAISIGFSTLSIFASYAFAIVVWRDLDRIEHRSIFHSWIKLALVFNVLSSFGPFTLAYMMASHNILQNVYLASVYFFLHFQYNGWFFFASMGLVSERISAAACSPGKQKAVFYLFALSCVPAYFLSILWLKLPEPIFVLVVLASLAQAVGWFLFLDSTIRNRVIIFGPIRAGIKLLLGFSAIAFSIKFLLQLGSTIPSLNKWAYGFRPIVIGYLHLVFLGGFTLFVLANGQMKGFLPGHRRLIMGVGVFIAGIILNEVFLMAEGLGGITYSSIPYINECLFAAAGLMAIGLILLNSPWRNGARPLD